MTIKDRVLLIEDERSIGNLIATLLEANGYDVITARTGQEALSLATSHCPDVILLDLGLPDMDGMEILRAVREWSVIPILVVSARTEEKDKVAALDAGADDYIVKPFGTAELLARIRAAIRHTRTASGNAQLAHSGIFTVGGLSIDYNSRRVYVDGVDANLTQNEFRLVALLGRYAGRVITYDAIIRQLWGPNVKKRQPDPARQHGKYPPQDRKKPRRPPVHFHRSPRGLPHGRRRARVRNRRQ